MNLIMKQQTIRTLVLAIAVSIISIGVASADTIYVPDNYETIQSAVTNANIDDIIIVRDGTYTENVDVGRRLVIRSENGAASCIVNALDPYDHVFEILADSVVINGFTVRNANGSSMSDWDNAGIHVTDSDQVDISDCVVENNVFGIHTAHISYDSILTRNIVRDNTYGIHLASSPYATLTENSLSNNRIRNLGTSGTNSDSYWHKHNIDTTNTVNGMPVYYYVDSNDLIIGNLDAGHISLVDCNNATIRGCSVIGCDELRLISTDDSLIEGNTVCSTEYAIWLLYSSNNVVRDNTANDNDGNGNGIRVQHGVNNRIGINTLKRNYMGVYVECCENSTIINNRIEDNRYGCWLYNNNLVTGNTIIDNGDTSGGCGISFAGSSSNNLIYNNYFDNPNNARDTGNNIWNTADTAGPNIVGGSEIGGNYWSDYTGTDGDGDGFGDEPYDNIMYGTGTDHLPLVYAPATCGDITGDGTIDTVDLLLLLEYAAAGTPVDACTGDIDGNGHINSLDVLLLMGYINNPAGYSLHCGC